MLPEEIAKAIQADRFDPQLRGKLRAWACESSDFAPFLAANGSKIASKLKGATTHEDQRDVGIELFTALALVDGNFRVTPEPQSAGPDFLVEYEQQHAWVEVRRFRPREETEQWEAHCADLRRAIEPLVPPDLDVYLGILGNYHNYRYGRHPGLEPPLVEFEDAKDDVIEFVRRQLAAPPHKPIKLEVPCLPMDFAQLRLTPMAYGKLRLSFPVVYLTEADRLLDAASRKSKQLATDGPNIVVFWMTNISETYDDFEMAVRKRRNLLEKDPADFCKRHKFSNPAECARLWQRCSAFVISDSENDYPILWRNPEAICPVPSGMAVALETSFRRPF